MAGGQAMTASTQAFSGSLQTKTFLHSITHVMIFARIVAMSSSMFRQRKWKCETNAWKRSSSPDRKLCNPLTTAQTCTWSLKGSGLFAQVQLHDIIATHLEGPHLCYSCYLEIFNFLFEFVFWKWSLIGEWTMSFSQGQWHKRHMTPVILLAYKFMVPHRSSIVCGSSARLKVGRR